jgi:hypothetical protein
MMRAARNSVFAAMCGLVFAISSAAASQQVRFEGNLKGANEIPAVQSPASGSVVATFDPTTRVLEWTITYSGLSDPPFAMHFHGPADATRNAGVALPIMGDLKSPVKGSASLTESQVADLIAGLWYLNIHTQAEPSGELRAQVTAKSAR